MGGVKNTYEENGDDTKINTQVHAILIYYFWFSLRIQLSGTVEYIWKYTEKDYRLTKDKSLKFIRRGEERKKWYISDFIPRNAKFPNFESNLGPCDSTSKIRTLLKFLVAHAFRGRSYRREYTKSYKLKKGRNSKYFLNIFAHTMRRRLKFLAWD